MPGTRLSHEVRRERRQEMAAYAAAGHTVAETAQQFNVSSRTAANAIKAAGVTAVASGRVGAHFSAYEVIADLINTDLSLGAIARKRSLTRQRVAQIRDASLAAGIPMQPRTEEESCSTASATS